MVAQLLNKFPAKEKMLIIMFRNPFVVPIMRRSQINSTYSLFLRIIFMLSKYICLDLLSGVFPSTLSTKKCFRIAPGRATSPTSIFFSTWRTAYIMSLIITKISPGFCYFLSVRLRYFLHLPLSQTSPFHNISEMRDKSLTYNCTDVCPQLFEMCDGFQGRQKCVG
jgi:hypothetical protein